MASRQRYRSGPSAPVTATRQGGTGLVFEIGDLVSVQGQYVRPASSSADTAVDLFQDAFLGVLVQGADDGKATADAQVLVEVDGDFEYDLAAPAAAAAATGQLVIPAVAGGFIQDQVVAVGVGTEFDTAIGRLAAPVKVGDRTVLVRIVSRVMAETPLII
jgi:hypothetical protein